MNRFDDRMRRAWKARLCSAAMLVVSMGCSGPYLMGPSVVAMDTYARDNVTVTAQRLERHPDGRLAYTAQIFNELDQTLELQVQVDFLGADGYTLGDTTNWEHILIGPKETYTLRVPSLRDDLGGYELRMRRPLSW